MTKDQLAELLESDPFKPVESGLRLWPAGFARDRLLGEDKRHD
jgi:hypothetical protein